MSRIIRCLLAAITICTLPLLALPATGSSSDRSQSIQSLIDQYHDSYQSSDTKKKGEYISAIQLSTYHNGVKQTYVSGSIGHASSQAVTNDSLFAWGSITKEFTAAIILQLQERDSLNLNQTLSDWFPDKFIDIGNKQSPWPKAWAKVSIAELLNMTSGIPNFYTKDFLNKRNLFLTNWKPEDLVQRSVNYYRSGKCTKGNGCFSPGTNYSYSNTNYIIASIIATKAAGIPFDVQMRDLFNRSKIRAYYYPHIAPSQYLSGRIVHGYFFDTTAYGNLPVKNVSLGFDTINSVQLSTGADGALIGNTDSMIMAVRNLFTGEMLSKKMTDILNADYYVNAKDGAAVSNLSQCSAQNTDNRGCFGLGVSMIYDDTFGPIWFYEGEVGGFRSRYMWIPNKMLLVCASVNSSVSSFGGNNDNLGQLVNSVVAQQLKR